MSDLAAAEAQWHAWIAQACAAVGVDPAQVDVEAIHGLTRAIAHGFSRPMAPVGAFMLGLALGGSPAAEPHEVLAALEGTFAEVSHA